ncbi:hypothetical protein FRB98_007095, partial [Tulasnella sp. 332]
MATHSAAVSFNNGNTVAQLPPTKFYTSLVSGQAVKDRLTESLKRLQLEYVDIYLIHTPVSHLGKLKDIWKQIEAVQKEGLAKNIEVPNFRIKDYEEFIADANIIPICNQQKHGIVTTSFGALYPLKKHKYGPLKDILPVFHARYSKKLGGDISDEQILLKWSLSKGVLPVTMSSKKERLALMVQTPGLPGLEQADMDQIDDAGRKAHHRAYIGTALCSKDASGSVTTAIEAGFTHIDTAEAYANDESVGLALKKYFSIPSTPASDSIFITTKLSGALEPGQTLKDVWMQMESVQKDGIAKNVRLSNWGIKDYQEFIVDVEILPVRNQIDFNPYLIDAAEPIIALQEKHGILTTSFGGLNPIHKHKGGPSMTERLTSILKTAELADLQQSEMTQINEAGRKEHRRQY